MRRHRVITTAALLALALPATAEAGSLLSGYGGPGQGNQAILGATVVGGASGGSGGGSSGGGSSATGESSSPSALSIPTPKTSSTPGGGAKTHRAAKGKAHPKHASVSPGAAYRATSTLSARETASVGTPALGISGADLVYILLAFAALVLTAAATGRLVRRPH
ncbi:MAG: hypothetical protein H0X28_14535 [Solirubrobacterales bacterium]|nr:hypothetical protein [Solirubrobacterales bacterium]